MTGIADCQGAFRFTTSARASEVRVYPLGRRAGAERFTLRLTIR